MLLPVYYNMADRYDPSQEANSYLTPRQGLISWKDILIKQGKDFRRSIDYLMTSDDINNDKLAYFGFSQGGSDGAIMMAIEDRIETAVFVISGLSTGIEKPSLGLLTTSRGNLCLETSRRTVLHV